MVRVLPDASVARTCQCHQKYLLSDTSLTSASHGLKTLGQRSSCERLLVTQMSASKLQLETARRLVQQETQLLRCLASCSTRSVRVAQAQCAGGEGAKGAAHGQLPPRWDLFYMYLIQRISCPKSHGSEGRKGEGWESWGEKGKAGLKAVMGSLD